MTSRKKPQFTPIQSLDECNKRLGQIAALQRDLAGVDETLNTNIDRAKALAHEQSQPFKDQLTLLENSLIAYAEYQKLSLFKDKKSIELLAGDFGYRKSTSIKPKRGKKVADIIKTIKTMQLKTGLKTTLALDKDAMRKWTDKQLSIVGAKREETEKFWYEVKKETVT